jgi:predicted RNA-binding Zn ribbon-like protein
MLGAHAGEVMAVAQVTMLGGLPYTVLRDGILAHPTLAEGLNMLFAGVRAEVVTQGAGGGSVSAALLVQLNAALREEAGSFTEVRRVKEGFERRTRLALDAPGEVLSPLLRASAELLTEVDLTLVRKCADAACVLFFHDVSKNHARQWCSMENCGNRHKVSAFRSRGAR